MEPSGIYDTQILIQDVQKKFIIPYHTKYKRIKKNTKKDRRIDVEGKDDKDDNNMDEDDDADSGPDEKDGQERWLLFLWTVCMTQIWFISYRVIYEWIRVDPEIDWLCELTFEQPDHMAVSQLHKDKDVAAQYEVGNLV